MGGLWQLQEMHTLPHRLFHGQWFYVLWYSSFVGGCWLGSVNCCGTSAVDLG